MRKWTKFILPFVAVLILGLLITPYFFGMIAEHRLTRLIELAANTANITVSQKSYHRSWFSSTGQYVIQASSESNQEAGQESFLLNVSLTHGPLILSMDDAEFELNLGYALIQTELIHNSKHNNGKHFFENVSLLTSRTQLQFNGDSQTQVFSEKFEYENKLSSFKTAWNDLSLNINISSNLEKVDAKWDIKDLTIAYKRVSLNFSKLRLSNVYSYQKKYDIWLGTSIVRIPFAMLAHQGKQKIIFNDFYTKTFSNRLGHVVNTSIDVYLNKAIYNETVYGPFIADLEMDNLDMRAWRQFKQTYLLSLLSGNPQLLKTNKPEVLARLLSRGFRLRFDTLSLQTPEGEISVLFWITLPNLHKQDNRSLKFLTYNAESALYLTLPNSLTQKLTKMVTNNQNQHILCDESLDLTSLQLGDAERKFLSWLVVNLVHQDINNSQFSITYKNYNFYVNGKLYNLVKFLFDEE